MVESTLRNETGVRRVAQTMKRPGAEAPVVNPRPKRAAPWPVTFYRSAVGKKWVMALTGVAMLLFLIGHLVGNLKIYLGAEGGGYAIDHYAHALRTLLHPIMPNQVVLWILRIGLMIALVLHVHSAATLTIMNRKARPVGYQSTRDYIAANFASRSMRYTGIIVAAYLVFHLLDLTWGKTGDHFVAGRVHDNMIASMQRWPVAIAYIVANIAVAVHLYHGTWSVFQSMGLNNPRYNAARRVFAVGISTLIGVGNVLFPLLIVTRVVK
ncbi:MAG: succinate dehydrogenase cytochrome b subunit [Microthrixaceae bacterium]